MLCRNPHQTPFPHCQQQQNPTGATLPRPTHSTISDERVTQLGDFIPRERDFRQEDLPALDHDFLALGVVLGRSGMPGEGPEGPAAAAGHSSGAALTEYSSEVRLMKRRKSSPPEDTATEESTRDKVSMASRRLFRRPWMVSPGERQRRVVRASPWAQPGLSGVPAGSPGPTSVLLEESQQRADGGHGRGDIGVVPQLRPERLDQV